MNIDQLLKIIKETDKIFFEEKLRFDVTKKGDADFATRADYEISDYLHRRLREEFPDVGFISEEGDADIDPQRDYWILDPIDGTTNFMHGWSLCCVSLGLYSGGDFTLGIIYVPYTKEFFWAEKGKGAYLNGERIQCSKTDRLCDSLALFEFNPYFKNDYRAAMDHATRLYAGCQDFRTLGCAALELAYVACGKADAFLGRYLKPWDYAAGVCIVREAGGTVGSTDGALSVDRKKQHIVAANALVYKDFLKLISQ